MVAQTGVGIWKGGLQKADDQVGIGDFHAIDRDEGHLSTRRIANALLGDGFEGDSLETKMSCQLRRKRRQRRDPARDVGIENAEAVQSHDSRSKMDLIVRVHIDGDLLHHGRPSSRFTLTAVSRPDRRQRLRPSFLVHVDIGHCRDDDNRMNVDRTFRDLRAMSLKRHRKGQSATRFFARKSMNVRTRRLERLPGVTAYRLASEVTNVSRAVTSAPEASSLRISKSFRMTTPWPSSAHWRRTPPSLATRLPATRTVTGRPSMVKDHEEKVDPGRGWTRQLCAARSSG